VRLHLVVNPTASSVTPRVRAAIVDALSVRHQLEVSETTSRDHASALASEAAANGAEVVVVLAGDGTLNEVTQGLSGTDTALAPLPGGSTNVFARTLGIAFEPLDACAQLLLSLDTRQTTRVGVGVAANGSVERTFMFHLGVGFDAAAVREMEQRHAHLKRRLAHPAFGIAIAEAWLRRYDRTTRIEVSSSGPGGTAIERATGPYAVVSNSNPYTYVGRRRVALAPAASLERALAVTVFRTLRLGVLLRAAGSGVSRARYVDESPDIAQYAEVWTATLVSERPFPWQVDGDDLGDATELRVRYVPDQLSLVVPIAPRARGRGRR
jgi:diacylglycerol kinase family enzyme